MSLVHGAGQWVDTHTHLDHEYPFPLDEYLANARSVGVGTFITIGTTLESFERVKVLAEQHAEVFFTIGIHPHEAKDYSDAVEARMSQLRLHPKCVAVGEIGLDYYYDHSPRDIQKRAFERQLQRALEWKKPVSIHARDAEDDLLERLTRYAQDCRRTNTSGPGPGVIHCFSGTRQFARRCLELGFFISFSGILTFKKADELRAIASEVPLDRLLLETDAPYLAPMPYRGKPNQSAYLIETAKILSAVKGISTQALSSATVANSQRIFGLPSR